MSLTPLARWLTVVAPSTGPTLEFTLGDLAIPASGEVFEIDCAEVNIHTGSLAGNRQAFLFPRRNPTPDFPYTGIQGTGDGEQLAWCNVNTPNVVNNNVVGSVAAGTGDGQLGRATAPGPNFLWSAPVRVSYARKVSYGFNLQAGDSVDFVIEGVVLT